MSLRFLSPNPLMPTPIPASADVDWTPASFSPLPYIPCLPLHFPLPPDHCLSPSPSSLPSHCLSLSFPRRCLPTAHFSSLPFRSILVLDSWCTRCPPTVLLSCEGLPLPLLLPSPHHVRCLPLTTYSRFAPLSLLPSSPLLPTPSPLLTPYRFPSALFLFLLLSLPSHVRQLSSLT